MKKNVIASILMILICMIFISCKSCVSAKYKQPSNDSIKYHQDIIDDIKFDTTIIYLDVIKTNPVAVNFPIVSYSLDSPIVVNSSIIVESQDTPKKTTLNKDIQQMRIDSLNKIKKDREYIKLEKTEQKVIEQQQKIDSLLIIKQKKK
jgi:hypothetical protein